MAADFTTVKQRITETLNACAAGTFSENIDSINFDRNADAIAEAAREGALMIARAILSNPNHVHRNLFVSGTPTALTHGAEIGDVASNISLVEIQPYTAASYLTGQLRDVQQIESYRNDTNLLYDKVAHNASGSRLSGYYAISNGRIYFTGYAARAYLPLIDRETVTDLIPDEYESTWVALGIGLTVKEGDNLMPVASYYFQHGQNDLVAVSQMSVIQTLPTPETARKARGNV